MTRNHGVPALVLILALTSMLALADPLIAQQSRNRSAGREAYESAKARDRNLQNRTMVMQHAGDADKKTLSNEELKAVVGQMKEDFKRLQIVNNNMMREVATRDALDYRGVLKATDEINKCAKRLQTLMASPDAEDKKDDDRQDPFDPKQMRPALFRLDDLIMGFVTSPLFKNLVDAENAEKARRDLAGIIELSGVIKRHAEKLGKSSSQ